MSQSTAYKISNSVKLTSLPPCPWEQPHPALVNRLSKVVLGPGDQEGDTTVSGGTDSAAYGNIIGDLALREALADEMKHVYGGGSGLAVDVTPEDIALTAGCNAAFMAAVMVLAERGDEVIVPVPWYFNNEMTLRVLGIEPVPLPVSIEAGFLPALDRAESLITPRTKVIVLVTPNNPSGVTYPSPLIRSFVELAAKHKIALILDETYRDFVTPGPPHDLFTPRSDWNWRSNLIHLFSFSKSYRVPGHRLGALVADKPVIGEVVKILDCMHICPARPLQLALPSLLPSLRPDLAQQSAKLSKRHDIFRTTLEGSGWEIGASGAYFAIIKHPFKNISGIEVCRRLASELGVVLLPLAYFAPEGDSAWDSWMRVSVANVGESAVHEAALRIRDSGKVLGWEV